VAKNRGGRVAGANIPPPPFNDDRKLATRIQRANVIFGKNSFWTI